jgi:hypothetical protein
MSCGRRQCMVKYGGMFKHWEEVYALQNKTGHWRERYKKSNAKTREKQKRKTIIKPNTRLILYLNMHV